MCDGVCVCLCACSLCVSVEDCVCVFQPLPDLFFFVRFLPEGPDFLAKALLSMFEAGDGPVRHVQSPETRGKYGGPIIEKRPFWGILLLLVHLARVRSVPCSNLCLLPVAQMRKK